MSSHNKTPDQQVTAKLQELRTATSVVGQADDFNAFVWWWQHHPGITSVADLLTIENMVQPVLEQTVALNRMKQEAFQKHQQLIRQVQSSAQGNAS